MGVFILLYFSLIISTVFTWRRENRTLFYVLSIFIILLPALRDLSVGADTETYVKYFLHPNEGHGDDTREFERGYVLWNDVIRFLWDNGNFFVFLTSLLSVGGVVFFIRKQSPFKVLSLLLFTIINQLYIIHFLTFRQSIAIAFYLVALHFYASEKRGSKMKALGLFIAASFFHTTVLTGILVPILDRVKISKRLAYIVLIVTFSISIFGLLAYRDLLTTAFSFVGGLNSSIDRYSIYASNMADLDLSDSHRILWDMLPLTLVCLVCYRYADNEELNSFYLKSFFAAVILNNILVSYPMRERVTTYLMLPIIIVIPRVFERKKPVAVIVYSIIIIYFLYKSIWNLLLWYIGAFGTPQITPYHTFF